MKKKKKTVRKESPILMQGCGGGSEQKTLNKPQRSKYDQTMPPLIQMSYILSRKINF